MSLGKRIFSAPTSTNLEITEACNVKCTHCYNFWREDSMGGNSLNIETLDKVIDKLIETQVFHVILSGGEPFAKFKILKHALKRLGEAGMSLSVNTNLMLANDDKCKELYDLGLDHVLTSLPSSDPVLNDRIMQSVGSFESIMQGIDACRRNGIRVSVNHVINNTNYDGVYEAAKLVAGKGAQKIFITRAVPPTYSKNAEADGYLMEPEKLKSALDAALQAKADFGIGVGSLVSYPLCFLGDLVKYKDFIGRGCPAQRGSRFSINSTGDVHACVHEERSYGNVFEQDIPELYDNMMPWHDGSYRYSGCAGCRYADVCESGCRMSALGAYGELSSKDPLYVGPHAFTRDYELDPDNTVASLLTEDTQLYAPKRLRFRQEDGFTLLNIRWGNTITISDEIAAVLKRHQESGASFTSKSFEAKDFDLLVGLIVKDAVTSPDLNIDHLKEDVGLSLNLESLFMK